MKLYSSKCPQCNTLERILNSKGISYELVNISEDAEALQFLIDKGLTHAPILELEDGTFLKFAEALKWARGN